MEEQDSVKPCDLGISYLSRARSFGTSGAPSLSPASQRERDALAGSSPGRLNSI